MPLMGSKKKKYLDRGVGGWVELYPNYFWIFGFFLTLQSPLLKINEKDIFCEFLKSLISHSSFPKITFPTRFSRTSGTLIDNFFRKLTRSTFDVTSGILIKSFSDHQPYFIFLNCENTNKKPPNKFILIRSLNESSFLNVENDLQSSNIITLMEDNVDQTRMIIIISY